MMRKIGVIFCCAVVWVFGAVAVWGQDVEPTTASSVADAVVPWGAQRMLPGSVPADVDQTFDKLLAAAGSGVTGSRREVLVWDAGANASKIRSELQGGFRKEGWQYRTAAKNGDVEFFALVKDSPEHRAVMGFIAAGKGVLVCGLMEVEKAAEAQAETPTATEKSSSAMGSTGGLVGKWFRTTGGSTRDWTGKTTLKGGDDFTFEFAADGAAAFTRKKEIINIMQCHITELQTARGRYSLSGSTLTVNLGPMSSKGTNSCDAKGNYTKTLESSTMTVQVDIHRLDDISRPDRPVVMCFDGSKEVCYEKSDG